MQDFRLEMKGDIHELRLEVKEDMHSMETRLEKSFNNKLTSGHDKK